jgi:aminoglycoside/choline kinase family phosphotransferase
MDAPPGQEDCLPFVRIAGYLEAMHLNAPRIIEANLEEGFLLLSDSSFDDAASGHRIPGPVAPVR